MKTAAYRPQSLDELERPYVIYAKRVRHDPGWQQHINKWHIWLPHRGARRTPLMYCSWIGPSDSRTRKHITADVPWCERCRARFLFAVWKYWRAYLER